jgi:hypothetical protein
VASTARGRHCAGGRQFLQDDVDDPLDIRQVSLAFYRVRSSNLILARRRM